MAIEESLNNNYVKEDPSVGKDEVNEDSYSTPISSKEATENTDGTMDEFNYSYNG